MRQAGEMGQSLQLKNTGLGEAPPPASREALTAQSHSLRPLALLHSCDIRLVSGGRIHSSAPL